MTLKPLIVTVLLAGLGTLAVWHNFQPTQAVKLYATTVATVIDPVKPLPEFSLTDSHNQTFTNTNLLDKWSLLYFGYSSCRSICPSTLMVLSHILRLMDNPDNLQVLFTTLDPKTDTPKQLDEKLKRFGPTLLGLTGEQAVIDELSKACSVYHWKDPNSKEIDHSGTVILLNPMGQIRAYFTTPLQPDAITKDLHELMKSSS